MDAVFNTNDQVNTTTANAGNEAKKAKIKAMKDSLKETVQSQPDFQEKLRRLSDSIKVVNTLGYGKNGNIIVDKKVSTDDNRVLAPTSQIVGYKVQNIGSENIEYTTEVYTQDETGKYVGSIVTKTLAPGETIDLTRAYMTALCARPEISFTLANGKIVSSARKAKSLKEELSAYYFSFDKDENGNKPEVNDDEVKLSIDVDGVVKPEYVEAFGYLNNPKEGRASKGKSDPKFTTQDLAANYINKLLQENGGL